MTPVLSTVLLDPPTTLLFGCGLAVFSTLILRSDPAKQLALTGWLSAAWSAWYGVCVGWMFFVKTDWMFVYLVDSKNVPLVPAFLLFEVLLVFFGVLGALATSWLVVNGRLGLAISMLVGALLTVAAIGLLQGHQYLHVGTYAEYLAGTAPSIPDLPDMQRGLNFAGLGAAPTAFGLIGWRFWQGWKKR